MLKFLERTLKSLFAALLKILLSPTPVTIPQDDSIRKILVIRQHNQLGDMLCVVPLLRALRERYPHAAITLLASPLNSSVMVHNRYLDNVMVYDKTRFLKNWRLHPVTLFRFLRSLRREAFDVVLVPATVSLSFTSDLLAFLSGASVRIGAGKLEGKESPSAFMFNHPVELDWHHDPHRHQGLRNWDISKPLNLSKPDTASEMTLLEDELQIGKRFVEEEIRREGAGSVHRARRLMAFHPGAGKVPNQWPADRFASVANQLAQEFDAHVFVTSGPMDEQPVGAMQRGLRVPHTLISSRPIREVAAMLAQMNLVISNDTGIMHVAAAVGVPVLSLFGPTDPLQWAPTGSKHKYLLSPDGHMESIREEAVLSEARRMLKTSMDEV